MKDPKVSLKMDGDFARLLAEPVSKLLDVGYALRRSGLPLREKSDTRERSIRPPAPSQEDGDLSATPVARKVDRRKTVEQKLVDAREAAEGRAKRYAEAPDRANFEAQRIRREASQRSFGLSGYVVMAPPAPPRLPWATSCIYDSKGNSYVAICANDLAVRLPVINQIQAQLPVECPKCHPPAETPAGSGKRQYTVPEP